MSTVVIIGYIPRALRSSVIIMDRDFAAIVPVSAQGTSVQASRNPLVLLARSLALDGTQNTSSNELIRGEALMIPAPEASKVHVIGWLPALLNTRL